MKDKLYKVNNAFPKQLPIKCPVCNGFGNLKYGTLTCHGCKGRGYVLVDAKGKDEK